MEGWSQAWFGTLLLPMTKLEYVMLADRLGNEVRIDLQPICCVMLNRLEYEYLKEEMWNKRG